MATDMLVSAEHDIDAGKRGHGIPNIAEPTSNDFEIAILATGPDTHFEQHYHAKDQLAWMPGGAVALTVGGARWHLRRDRFAWIPAGTLHEMAFTEPGEVIDLYTDVRLRPRGERWNRPCTITVPDLANDLIWHLVDEPRSLARSSLCLALLRDLLQTAEVCHDTLALPDDPRARQVAMRLLTEPADDRELGDWAGELGVSERTLSRAFVASVGCTFRQWRQLARMHAAAGMLMRGDRVAAVAEEVGYATASGFIAAFSDRFGVTPLAYARQQSRGA